MKVDSESIREGSQKTAHFFLGNIKSRETQSIKSINPLSSSAQIQSVPQESIN